MAGVLAPSNVGYKQHSISVKTWNAPMSAPYGPHILATPTILRSWKSPTQKSNGIMATNYTRMISKFVSGPWEGRSYDWARKGKAEYGTTISVQNIVAGCNISVGSVQVPGWLMDKAIADARAEMNQLAANLLEDLGQLRSTGELIADIVRMIGALFIACTKGNFKAVRRELHKLGSNVPRKVANGWLMYFYGIKPLISTIDALTASAKPIHRKMKVLKRASMASPDPLAYVGGRSWMTYEGQIQVSAQCQLQASVKMSGNEQRWASLGLTSSLLTDAVVTAWALTPYSFVFDWFIPVEQYLRSLSWSPSLEYQGGFIGRRHHGDLKIKDPWPVSGMPPWQEGVPEYRYSCRFYQRVTYPYFVPGVYLNLRLTLNANQIMSASALIVARS